LHDFSLRFLASKTLAETQTLQRVPVYNAWLDVVAHQARFPLFGAQKKLDFDKNLALKWCTYAQSAEKYAHSGAPRTDVISV
jgi:hypothetical protein